MGGGRSFPRAHYSPSQTGIQHPAWLCCCLHRHGGILGQKGTETLSVLLSVWSRVSPWILYLLASRESQDGDTLQKVNPDLQRIMLLLCINIHSKYVTPPNMLWRKKVSETEIIGRKEIAPIKMLIPPYFLKLKQNHLL